MEYWFDKKAAARAVNFIERYVLHTEGAKAGEPFLLEKWQKEIVSDLFGWKRQDGTRRYRKSYIQVGRGNGKSTFVTALCLVAMFVDNEPAAFIAYAALNREQANMIGWKMMSETIEANPELSKLVKILKSVKTIEYRPIKNNEYSGLSIFKTVSRDSGGLHGLNCHIAVVDEYHTHPDSQVLDTLATSMLKRKNPLLLIITTSGFSMDGPCFKEYLYAKQLVEGKIKDDSYYAKVWEAPIDADIYSEETWKVANPNYGVSVFKSYFEEQIQRIKNEPSYENTFRVLHLSQWVNNESTWISDYDWNRIKHNTRIEELKGGELFLSFDLSATSDITALSGIVKKDDVYHSLNWFWLPRERYQGSPNYKNESFTEWVEKGYVTLAATRTVDYRLMYDKIKELDLIFNVVNIQYDPWNASILASELERDGFVVEKFRQGFRSMSLPTKKFREMIINGEFNHMENPVLRWMAGNATIMIDEADNYKVIKDKKQPHKKVDGVITNIMCLAAILQHEYEKQSQSYMETVGMIEL
jgi:phage terminase large subunit-like protein